MKYKRMPDEATLRGLYEGQRLTTRAIGESYGVSKTEVGRWLRHLGIPIRVANNGLVNRGVEPPTAAELHQMVHVEHLSYEQIAARYGVDFTAVPYWLKKHGIERPKNWMTRNKGKIDPLPPVFIVRYLYEGGAPLWGLAEHFGVSRYRLAEQLRTAGVELRHGGFDGGKRFICKDGLLVMSLYEQRTADWLIDHEVRFTYEPRLPFNRRMQADFQANGWFIEIWGVQGSADYDGQRRRKKELYERYGLPLIELLPTHFSGRNATFERRMAGCLECPPRGLPLFPDLG